MDFNELLERVEELDQDGWMKVVGGMAAGIGTVAALPILGPLGSVSALGALIGGGAGAGAVLMQMDDEVGARERGDDEALLDEDELAQRGAYLRAMISESASSLDAYYSHINAVYAVISYCCFTRMGMDGGSIGAIRNVLDRIFCLWLPKDVKNELVMLFSSPPSWFDIENIMKKNFLNSDLRKDTFEKVIEQIELILIEMDLVDEGFMLDNNLEY